MPGQECCASAAAPVASALSTLGWQALSKSALKGRLRHGRRPICSMSNDGIPSSYSCVPSLGCPWLGVSLPRPVGGYGSLYGGFASLTETCCGVPVVGVTTGFRERCL